MKIIFFIPTIIMATAVSAQATLQINLSDVKGEGRWLVKTGNSPVKIKYFPSLMKYSPCGSNELFTLQVGESVKGYVACDAGPDFPKANLYTLSARNNWSFNSVTSVQRNKDSIYLILRGNQKLGFDSASLKNKAGWIGYFDEAKGEYLLKSNK